MAVAFWTRWQWLPGGAALTGPTEVSLIVGRVRRSRHPATRAQTSARRHRRHRHQTAVWQTTPAPAGR
ncbi:hypothetical protein D4M88_22395 [Enterobacter roggenkampii]|nr:hypothetical protein D4M93_21945 [Enterobacter roggenkampii]TXU84909.1 hypothetical protein D4M95_22355 [Enterobacter roggenkampii]TXU95141.1 hypothetical protein D4M88_22395 [Enterobacter roggenkampii]TYF65335.1 hypothetical protein DJ544_21815 [Enterobacter roggenkampii]